MIFFRIIGTAATVALIAAIALGTRSALQRKNTQALRTESAAAILPAASLSPSPAVSAARDRYLSSLEATRKGTEPLTSLWVEFEKNLRAIQPDSPPIHSEADATAALAKASAWLEAREGEMADASRTAAVQASAQILAEIENRKKDLEELRKLAALPYREMLANLLVLGANRRTPQGIELVWIDDPAGSPGSGGFWAAKKEITTEVWGKVTDQAPAGRWTPPRQASDGDYMDEARTRFLASMNSQQRAAYDGASASARQQLLAAYSGNIAQIAASLRKAANANQADYSGFPAQYVNLPTKAGTEPFIQKMSAENPAGSPWTYRLPTSAEWSAMTGKVDGIGTPDVSEWLADKPGAVDKNWKANQATDPPAPGTVGFRVVFVESR